MAPNAQAKETSEINLCQDKLSELVRDIGSLYEIYPAKLYMINLSKDENAKAFCEQHANDDKCPFIFWGLHNSPKLIYEGFDEDFGPLNLAATHQFCSMLKVWLDTQQYRKPDKYVVVVLDDRDVRKKLNTTLLVAIAGMVLLNLTDDEVITRLNQSIRKGSQTSKKIMHKYMMRFSDVSGTFSAMSLTLNDCISAFYSAMQNKFYEYYQFDHAEYLFYETVMSGDLNWIIPGKILAFAGPSDRPAQNKNYHRHSPQFYHQYFKDHNVSTVVRLNSPEYDAAGFTSAGFDHRDLIFPDGFAPSSTIAETFIKIVDEAKGAVAVHCYAGIGRTGTLIAAYLMTRYSFSAQMAIAWTRICRPGSVIGEQQDWLYLKFDGCTINRKPKPNPNLSSTSTETKATSTTTDASDQMDLDGHKSGLSGSNINFAAAEKTYGQAKALLMIKNLRGSQDRPCTRNSSIMKPLNEPTKVASPARTPRLRRKDVILDLGKTVPLMVNLKDVQDQTDKKMKKLEYYRIKDAKYVWKVKFPEPDYVRLKHNLWKDIQTCCEYGTEFEYVYSEPVLQFKNDLPKKSQLSRQVNGSPRALIPKPTVYFTVVPHPILSETGAVLGIEGR